MKLWKLTLVAALVLIAVLALASCGKCEHAYDEAITTKPTCTEEGVKTFTCSLCGESYTEPVAATGHTYTDEVVAPTCTEEGYTLHTCACGDSYKDTTVEAAGHTYDEVVTAPTCAAEGYTTYTCTVCADTYTGAETAKDPNAHIFETQITELTEEQAAANPYAIGIEKQVCSGCGAEGEGGDAVLIYLDFNELPDETNYEGSANYQTTISTYDASKHGETAKKLIAYFDMQKNLEAWTKPANITHDAENGKFVVGTHPFYVFNTLKLAQTTPAVPTYTVSFDFIVNKDPTPYTKKDRTPIFAMVDEKLYNNMNLTLALDKVDVDTNVADEVYSYELYAQSYKDGPIKVDAATGYYITLGQEYSVKFTVDSAAKMYHLYIKTAGEADYTDLGAFEYQPYGQDRRCAFQFTASSSGNGNVFDNFKVTTELAQ